MTNKISEIADRIWIATRITFDFLDLEKKHTKFDCKKFAESPIPCHNTTGVGLLVELKSAFAQAKRKTIEIKRIMIEKFPNFFFVLILAL